MKVHKTTKNNKNTAKKRPGKKPQLSTKKIKEMPNFRLIHGVMNIVHRKKQKKTGLHRKGQEHMFCEEIINMINYGKYKKKFLTIQY